MDTFWHAVNFFGPALGLSTWAAVIVKLVWWRDFRNISLASMVLWAFVCSACASLIGVWLLGEDGKMLTHLGMVLACALNLGWRAWGPVVRMAAAPKS